MPDRLAELVRQRALLQDHLAWLEREIAAASTVAGSGHSSASSPVRPTAAVGKPSPHLTAHAIAEMPAEFRVSPATVKAEVRKGCFIYFAAAMLLVLLVVAILYFALGPR